MVEPMSRIEECMNPTQDQSRRYFESRLQGKRLSYNAEQKVCCCFHDDRIPSLSINTEKGVWKCHAGCGEGGLIAFEMKFSSCDEQQARDNIAKILGMKNLFTKNQKPEAVYQYHDATGKVVFEKLRMPGKRFVLRKPDGKGGWDHKLGEGKRPLYHLPEVLVANEIFICEGEKDADNVSAPKSWQPRRRHIRRSDHQLRWRRQMEGRLFGILRWQEGNDPARQRRARREARASSGGVDLSSRHRRKDQIGR